MSVDRMAIRRKIMGVALRSARLAQRRSLEDCAQALGVSAEQIAQYERGERDISLPELETLADFLNASVPDLLSGRLPATPKGAGLPSPESRLLRAKIIGAQLRKARQEAGRGAEEVAAQLGCHPEALALYERGQEPLPVVQLQALADFLGVEFATFLRPSPAARPAVEAHVAAVGSHLPPEVREFIAAPQSEPYLRVALELSRLPAAGLKAIAEALLAAQASG